MNWNRLQSTGAIPHAEKSNPFKGLILLKDITLYNLIILIFLK
ncbi:MAG: hypothetical protein JWQ14_578 [Adhaeribacter sp.]|nr:hypothetical protein [Adhaeribacter sp.]